MNGKEIADLVLLLFRTCARIGEVGGLRWRDVDFGHQTITITGSLLTLNGKGTARQERTKTEGSIRTVPLADDAAQALAARAIVFDIDLSDPLALDRPVFGSPQFPERWRDYRNLTRASRNCSPSTASTTAGTSVENGG